MNLAPKKLISKNEKILNYCLLFLLILSLGLSIYPESSSNNKSNSFQINQLNEGMIFPSTYSYPKSLKLEIKSNVASSEKVLLLDSGIGGTDLNFLQFYKEGGIFYLQSSNQAFPNLSVENVGNCLLNYTFESRSNYFIQSLSCGSKKNIVESKIKDVPQITSVFLRDDTVSINGQIEFINYSESTAGYKVLLRIIIILYLVYRLLEGNKIIRQNSLSSFLFSKRINLNKNTVTLNLLSITLISWTCFILPPQDDDSIFIAYRNLYESNNGYFPTLQGSQFSQGHYVFKILGFLIQDFTDLYQYRLITSISLILTWLIIHNYIFLRVFKITNKLDVLTGFSIFLLFTVSFGVTLRAEIVLYPLFALFFYILLYDKFSMSKKVNLFILLTSISLSVHQIGIVFAFMTLSFILLNYRFFSNLVNLKILFLNSLFGALLTFLLLIYTYSTVNSYYNYLFLSKVLGSTHKVLNLVEISRYLQTFNQNSVRALSALIILLSVSLVFVLISISKSRKSELSLIVLLLPLFGLSFTLSKWPWHFGILATPMAIIFALFAKNHLKLSPLIRGAFILSIWLIILNISIIPTDKWIGPFKATDVDLIHSFEKFFLGRLIGEFLQLSFSKLFFSALLLVFIFWLIKIRRNFFYTNFISLFFGLLFLLVQFTLAGLVSNQNTVAKNSFSKLFGYSDCGIAGETRVVNFSENHFVPIQPLNDLNLTSSSINGILNTNTIVLAKDVNNSNFRFALKPFNNLIKAKYNYLWVKSNGLVLNSSPVNELLFSLGTPSNYEKDIWTPVLINPNLPFFYIEFKLPEGVDPFIEIVSFVSQNDTDLFASALRKGSSTIVDGHLGTYTPCFKFGTIENGQFIKPFDYSAGDLSFTDGGIPSNVDMGFRVMREYEVFELGCPAPIDWFDKWCFYSLIPKVDFLYPSNVT
jgi:hypothetical protein